MSQCLLVSRDVAGKPSSVLCPSPFSIQPTFLLSESCVVFFPSVLKLHSHGPWRESVAVTVLSHAVWQARELPRIDVSETPSRQPSWIEFVMSS